jgi:hypothetical protein
MSFVVCFLSTCFWTLEISLQYIRKPARCQRTTVSGVTTRRACFHPDQTRRAITQKSLSRSPRTRARMSTLQYNELLTQARFSRRRLCRLRKRRTSMPKQSLTKRTMVRIYNKMVVRWQQLCY